MTATPLGPGPEFDRIRAIGLALGSASPDLGDDCAFLPDGWCVSTDLATDRVHFRREWLSFEEIGWRATAAALSDLAAVGAVAEAVLVAVSMPDDTTDEDLVAVMRGAGAAAQSVNAAVVGGDLTAGGVVTVAVTVMGRATNPVRRRGARVGDGVWVTGTLGGSRAALQAWRSDRVPAAAARERFARPNPRIAAGRALARAGATAMMDLSDGLGGDAGHLAAASGVGLAIDLGLVPIDPSVTEEAAKTGEDPAVFATTGGEDYELLVTLPSTFDSRSLDLGGVALTRIGTVTAESGVRLTLAGRVVTLAGYDHFR